MGWLIAILAGGLLTFNAIVTPDKAADEATKALQQKFPGADVKVAIEGKRGKDVLNGRFRKVDIELSNLTLNELPIASSASAPVKSIAPVAASPVVVRELDGAIKAGATRSQTAPAFKPLSIEKLRPQKASKPKLGRAAELNIAVRQLKWQNLPVDRADFHFTDVEYDFGALKNHSEIKLVRVGKSSMHLELAPEALAPFVAKRAENVTRSNLTLDDGQIIVTGARNFYGLSAPFELKGQPGFSGSQIVLTQPKLLVSGVTVPALVATPLLTSVNPLYSFDDLEGLPFAVKLTKVESRAGKLQIDGDLIWK